MVVAILLSGNGLLVTHAAAPNGQGSGNGNNSGYSHHSGSGTTDHSSGTNGGNNSPNTGNGDPSTQILSLGVQGMVVNAGTQHYIIQQSGQVLEASFLTYTINTSQPTHLSYNLNAMVQGTSASGNANFYLTGSLVGGGMIQISGNAPIVGAVAAVCLPHYDPPNSTGYCPSSDTSEVPAMFIGMATIQVTAGPVHTSLQNIPMLFQSAYLNPFGAPIVLGTADGFSTMQIVTTYNHATVDWSNIVDESIVSGTIGSTPVTGTFTQVAQEHENLVTGIARDHGTITFTMSDPSLDSSGHYSGSSMTPTTQSSVCSTTIPCTNYGFESTGIFHTSSTGSQSVQMSGSYGTSWGIPAFDFTGTITAVVS